MTRWYDLEPADAAIFSTAPEIHRFPVRLAVPPARVWQSLQSEESLAAWGRGVRSLTWTSSRPFGVGSTREVTLPLGVATVRERFFRWDEGRGYSFYVEQCDRPLFRRFAENYVVEADGSGSLFTWIIAIDPAPRLAPVARFGRPVNRVAFGQVARSAKKYFAAHPTA